MDSYLALSALLRYRMTGMKKRSIATGKNHMPKVPLGCWALYNVLMLIIKNRMVQLKQTALKNCVAYAYWRAALASVIFTG
jgi:hypothetical protein